MNIPSWDELFMRNVYLIASKSRDKSSQLGSVIVRDKRVIQTGYNGLPQGVEYDDPAIEERPEKYHWFEHSERNSFFSCSRHGIATLGAVLYTQGIPCSDCARAAIQSGIIEVIYHKQWQDKQHEIYPGKWTESLKRSVSMFEKAKVKLRSFDMYLDTDSLMNGQLIKV